MPPKRKPQQTKKKPNQKTKQEPGVLPPEPTDPPQPLSLDTYEVDGKAWLLASNNLSLSSFIDPLTDGKLPSRDKDVGKVLSFLLGNPGVEEGEADGQWRFARYLGAGGFGRVGLWAKESPDGAVIDRIAVKEADHNWVDREATKVEPNLPMEVAINRDLNTYDATHIAYLRNYKYGGRACPRGRLYLRHYQYGDLEKLHKAYAIYGHWLPEWFCFEVIRDLCLSLAALSKPPPEDTKVDLTYLEGKAGDKSIFQAVHQDIKPENVFLDEGKPGRPVPVLADFGEADYTHLNDPKNPAHLVLGGTVGYKPAEELRAKDFYERKADGESFDAEYRQQALKPIIPSANNVWGIGRILFELMTHVQGADFGRCLQINDGLADYDDGYEHYVAQQRFSADRGDWQDMISKVIHTDMVGSFPYSADLLELVADILDPDPRERPNIARILIRAEEGLKKALAAYESEGGAGKKTKKSTKGASRKQTPKSQRPVLYYTQEQWASMPPGPIKWKETGETEDELGWLRLWAYQLMLSLDPDGPLIKQPTFMKKDDRMWARTSDLQRSMAVQDAESGKLIRMGDVRLLKFNNAAELEASIAEQHVPAKKRKRDDGGNATKPAPAQKNKPKKGASKDADVDQEEDEDEVGQPPAKTQKTQPSKLKKDADKVQKAPAPARQDAPGGRSLRTRKAVNYAA